LALLVFGGIAGFVLVRSTGGSITPRRIDQLTHNNSIFPGVPEMESFPVLVSDGNRLYSSVLDNGQTEIASIDAATGEMQRLELPSEIVNPTIGDISPDGSRLLVRSHLSSDSEEPVWVVPRNGGSALRVGKVLAHDAAWMPDGQSILYADGNNLDVIRIADGSTTHLTVLPGRAIWMRWSPDGKLLRFTVVDPLSHTSSLWQINNRGKPQPILSGWTSPAAECCGMWAPDGRSYVFQSSHDGSSDLWRLRNKSTFRPEKLTNGPLRSAAPIVGRDSDRIYFVGLDVRSELQRFDQSQQRFVAERDFLSEASRVSYSRDRQWVAWIDGAQHLWRGRAADGTEKVQLTPDTLRVFLAQWSPDGHHLLAMARESGRSWQIFLVDAEGGSSVLLHENRNEADPTWSGDGKQVAFGRTTDLMGREDGPKQIEVLDLATGKSSVLPGSDGLFSPRWSPDGRWIAALTLGEQRLMLYNVATRTWRRMDDIRAADPVWTADSSALYIHAAFGKPQTIQRITVPTGSSSVVVTLTNPLISDNVDYVFVGITRDDSPLVRVRTSTGNLYTLLLGR
jgi:Tol biopolymer transport system component